MVREDITGWVMLKMSVGSGGWRFCMSRICQVRRLDPTFIQRAADNIVKKQFFELPDTIFFYVFILPYSAPD
jgi:hypothetical protein